MATDAIKFTADKVTKGTVRFSAGEGESIYFRKERLKAAGMTDEQIENATGKASFEFALKVQVS